MKLRLAALGCAFLLAAAGGWWALQREPAIEAADSTLPVPPVPPRIAEGARYDGCLSMMATDPAGARDDADAWEAEGGGEGAAHCRALAEVALGNAETGAAMMEKLGAASHAPAVARASIYAQAGQAWMIAGDNARAYASATLALALDPDNPDLLVDHAIDAAGLERYAESEQDLDRALAIDPQRSDALVFRAAAARQLGHVDGAAEDIGRALALDPDSADALLERGILRQRRGDAAGARADWERAMSLAPDTATSDLAEQNLALLEAGPPER